MRSYRNIGIGLVSAAVLFPAGIYPALAQLRGTTVKPTLVEQQVQPGQAVAELFTLVNESEGTQTFYPVVRDVISMNELGAPVFAPEDREKSGAEMSSWTSFPAKQFILGPGQEAKITVTFSVPADAPHGGYFGLVAFLNKSPAPEGEESVTGIDYISGSLVALRVGDDVNDSAIIRSFKPVKKIIGSAEGAFELRMENTGNALIRPVGVIGINDMFGRTVASVSFNTDGGAILPGTVRRYVAEWQAQGLHVGRFEAFLAANYGEKEVKTLTATTSVWVLPGKLTLAVVGSLAAFFLIVYAWSRMYIRRRLRSAGVSAPSPGTSSGAMFLAALIAVIVTAFVLLGFALLFLV